MSILLDIHVVLSWLTDDPTLTDELKDRLDQEPDAYISPATMWEVAIKQSIGKLQHPDDLPGAHPRQRVPPPSDHRVITAEVPNRPLTLDDVTRIAEADPDHRFELSEGNLLIMRPGTWRHQEISGLLFAWLLKHGYRGRVNVAPGVRTATDNLNGRIPDLVVTTGPVAAENRVAGT